MIFRSVYFPLPGALVASAAAGGCNAVRLVRERDRWMAGHAEELSSPLATAASCDACEAYESMRRLAQQVGERKARKWVSMKLRRSRIVKKRRHGRHEWATWRAESELRERDRFERKVARKVAA